MARTFVWPAEHMWQSYWEVRPRNLRCCRLTFSKPLVTGLDARERTDKMTRFKFYVVANEKRDDENKVVRASKVLYPARGYDEYDAQIKKSNADLLDEPELRKVRDENGALKVSDVTVVYPFRQG